MNGRIRPVGLGVILFALLVLVIPLRMFHAGGHPLAAVENVDLCALLERNTLAALPGDMQEMQPEIPGFAERPTGACFLRLAGHEDQSAAPEVSVTLMNRHYLARGNIRFRMSKYVETFLDEERASGNAVETASGPWRVGATISRRGHDDQLDVLAEDDGVVLWFRSQGLDESALLDFARAATVAARRSEARRKS